MPDEIRRSGPTTPPPPSPARVATEPVARVAEAALAEPAAPAATDTSEAAGARHLTAVEAGPSAVAAADVPDEAALAEALGGGQHAGIDAARAAADPRELELRLAAATSELEAARKQVRQDEAELGDLLNRAGPALTPDEQQAVASAFQARPAVEGARRALEAKEAVLAELVRASQAELAASLALPYVRVERGEAERLGLPASGVVLSALEALAMGDQAPELALAVARDALDRGFDAGMGEGQAGKLIEAVVEPAVVNLTRNSLRDAAPGEAIAASRIVSDLQPLIDRHANPADPNKLRSDVLKLKKALDIHQQFVSLMNAPPGEVVARLEKFHKDWARTSALGRSLAVWGLAALPFRAEKASEQSVAKLAGTVLTSAKDAAEMLLAFKAVASRVPGSLAGALPRALPLLGVAGNVLTAADKWSKGNEIGAAGDALAATGALLTIIPPAAPVGVLLAAVGVGLAVAGEFLFDRERRERLAASHTEVMLAAGLAAEDARLLSRADAHAAVALRQAQLGPAQVKELIALGFGEAIADPATADALLKTAALASRAAGEPGGPEETVRLLRELRARYPDPAEARGVLLEALMALSTLEERAAGQPKDAAWWREGLAAMVRGELDLAGHRPAPDAPPARSEGAAFLYEWVGGVPGAARPGVGW